MIFDMSNDNKSSGPNQNYFGAAQFSFKDPNKQDPFLIFQKDPINGIMNDSINSDVNKDEEKILNPLIPQKHFGNKNKNKKKLGKITGINIGQNNNNKNKNKSNGIKKDNPWFKHDKSKIDNINYNNKTEEKSVVNPLEQFDISKTDVGLDTSMKY